MQISSARLLGRDLQDAAQLAYMSGRWVHTDRYGNTVIKIVESELPGNGNYSAGVANGEFPFTVALCILGMLHRCWLHLPSIRTVSTCVWHVITQP